MPRGTKCWNPGETKKDPHQQHETSNFNVNTRQKQDPHGSGAARHWVLNSANKPTNSETTRDYQQTVPPCDENRKLHGRNGQKRRTIL